MFWVLSWTLVTQAEGPQLALIESPSSVETDLPQVILTPFGGWRQCMRTTGALWSGGGTHTSCCVFDSEEPGQR